MHTATMAKLRQHRLFNLDPIRSNPFGRLVGRPLEKMLALPGINGIYDRVAADSVTAETFAEKCLADMNVAVQVSAADLRRIPRSGPLVVVANHPFGGVEGLVLASVMLRARPDFKTMVNYLLGLIPEMRPICVFVDPFGTNKQQNVKGLKECLSLLRNGGCLGVFPSGEVSSLNLKSRSIEDPKWSTHISGLIRRTGASVIPIYFEGGNGPLFQLAGLIHPRLRTALLPRATLNQRDKAVKLQIGRLISAREIGNFTTDQQVADYLRNRTYALAERLPGRPTWARRLSDRAGLTFRRRPRAVAHAVDPTRLERELAALGERAQLAQSGDLRCYLAHGNAAPNLLHEVGRLREITFRAVGEGTGRPVDVDTFDNTYEHLLVWNAVRRELVGGYRLGLTDRIVGRRGNAGLYISTLFQLPDDFFFKLGPTIELGRSFVRREYQRSFLPLMLLWKGIGAFVAREPKYRFLIGPVSVSNAYSPLSRALIERFMLRPECRHAMADTVHPRTPAKFEKKIVRRARLLSGGVSDFDDLNDLISDIEPDGKSAPILLKQYMKLGARALSFNVDPAFGQCLDCLCVLDMPATERRVAERYMGKQEFGTFLAAHGQ
ncbi:MAG TPA: GNAT family N-acyltransferase [Tepidisphaeraceae bacterium]|jgi:putative hemolysin